MQALFEWFLVLLSNACACVRLLRMVCSNADAGPLVVLNNKSFWYYVSGDRKKRLPRSEAAMAEAADLGPIQLQIDGHRLTFDGSEWHPEYEQLLEGEEVVEAELLELRREKRKMWTMRELDIKKSQDEVTSKRTRHSAA
ncbi:hypothetical protein R1sor_006994 [Riccia sorocarpa]|uniref:Uncharacterized protein n=1 Tax=Riccia sorocarpa TaxID=122646 RepID=A0ABD3HPP6_9MARC